VNLKKWKVHLQELSGDEGVIRGRRSYQGAKKLSEVIVDTMDTYRYIKRRSKY